MDIRSEIAGFMLDKGISLSGYDELEECHAGCGLGCLKQLLLRQVGGMSESMVDSSLSQASSAHWR